MLNEENDWPQLARQPDVSKYKIKGDNHSGRKYTRLHL